MKNKIIKATAGQGGCPRPTPRSDYLFFFFEKTQKASAFHFIEKIEGLRLHAPLRGDTTRLGKRKTG
jgi:hypothetical protein